MLQKLETCIFLGFLYVLLSTKSIGKTNKNTKNLHMLQIVNFLRVFVCFYEYMFAVCHLFANVVISIAFPMFC